MNNRINSLEVHSVPGNSQIAIEQISVCFVLFFYELPIFAIQNCVNTQISFIRFITSFLRFFGKEIISNLKITMCTFTVRILL